MSALVVLVQAGLLVALAVACLVDRRLARACLAFVGFALLMALAWWRLGAPWLGLAEALLGALLTGGALFHALGRDSREPGPAARDVFRRPWRQMPARLAAPLAWLALVAMGMGLPLDAVEVAGPAGGGRQPLLVAGLAIMTLGLWAFAVHAHLLRRLLAFNVLGSGVFLLLAGIAGPRAEVQALILVGLVVALLGTLLGVALIRRLHHLAGRATLVAEDEPGGGE
ncbi:hydrogenase subunit MbhD domain-containing protein [Halomonas sp. C05BenzN]|uniref:hydrogenase subunit MbhD domain-containing protein n=1 Tax=Halomonas sp. C05BenzN TaxID=3411041 RepID=UPI003B94C9D0